MVCKPHRQLQTSLGKGSESKADGYDGLGLRCVRRWFNYLFVLRGVFVGVARWALRKAMSLACSPWSPAVFLALDIRKP